MANQTQEKSPRSSAHGPATEAGRAAAESATAAFGDAVARFAEIREYISYYLAAQADSAKLILRKTLFFVVLGVVGLVAGATAVIYAVVLLLGGIADGIGQGLGHEWIGELLVGVLVLTALAIVAWIGISKVMGSPGKLLVKRYEDRKQQQRVQFGYDVEQRAQQQ